MPNAPRKIAKRPAAILDFADTGGTGEFAMVRKTVPQLLQRGAPEGVGAPQLGQKLLPFPGIVPHRIQTSDEFGGSGEPQFLQYIKISFR